MECGSGSRRSAAIVSCRCLWVKSDVFDPSGDVRFGPNSDRLLRCREMTLCAISDRVRRSKLGASFDHLVGAGYAAFPPGYAQGWTEWHSRARGGAVHSINSGH